MKYKQRLFISGLALLLSVVLCACGSRGGSGSAPPPPATRAFLMGTTPFFTTAAAFPDWRFENLDDKDLLSIHADDFWGVPWDQCTASGCTPPAAWAAKWSGFANDAKAAGRTLYLALSPLGGRKTLAPKLDSSGNKVENWAPVDVNGCYPFATDANAATYKAAYISYVKYLVNLLGPAHLSPAIEMNIPFTRCPGQKAAWIAWYTDVHNTIKAAYPTLTVFPTFQMEFMYGIVTDSISPACAGATVAECFDQRLTEALAIPGDRIAFSTYPLNWKFRGDYGFTYPTDTYARVQGATTRKIWVSETGWAAVKILASYQHGASGSCGADLVPASIANDTEFGKYVSWLLSEAQNRKFEAVIWWLNRDYLDGAVAATCPCSPATSDTCMLADAFYAADPVSGESLLRIFGNMALRYHDGSPRPGHATWRDYFSRSYRP